MLPLPSPNNEKNRRELDRILTRWERRADCLAFVGPCGENYPGGLRKDLEEFGEFADALTAWLEKHAKYIDPTPILELRQRLWESRNDTSLETCEGAFRQFLHLLRRIRFAIPAPKAKSENKTATMALESRALAIFFQDPTRTKKEIADKLGTHTQSLSPKRCPKLAAAMKAHQAGNLPVKGQKDAEGSLEAWDDEKFQDDDDE